MATGTKWARFLEHSPISKFLMQDESDPHAPKKTETFTIETLDLAEEWSAFTYLYGVCIGGSSLFEKKTYGAFLDHFGEDFKLQMQDARSVHERSGCTSDFLYFKVLSGDGPTYLRFSISNPLIHARTTHPTLSLRGDGTMAWREVSRGGLNSLGAPLLPVRACLLPQDCSNCDDFDWETRRVDLIKDIEAFASRYIRFDASKLMISLYRKGYASESKLASSLNPNAVRPEYKEALGAVEQFRDAKAEEYKSHFRTVCETAFAMPSYSAANVRFLMRQQLGSLHKKLEEYYTDACMLLRMTLSEENKRRLDAFLHEHLPVLHSTALKRAECYRKALHEMRSAPNVREVERPQMRPVVTPKPEEVKAAGFLETNCLQDSRLALPAQVLMNAHKPQWRDQRRKPFLYSKACPNESKHAGTVVFARWKQTGVPVHFPGPERKTVYEAVDRVFTYSSTSALEQVDLSNSLT